MKLNKIDIKNYRSIKEVTLELKHNCLILFGINETGKSNLLKAIRSLDDGFSYDYASDCKKPSDKNLIKYPSKFTFTFELNKEEKFEIFMSLIKEKEFNILNINKEEFDKIIKEQMLEISYNKDNKRDEDLMDCLDESKIDFSNEEFLRIKEEHKDSEHIITFNKLKISERKINELKYFKKRDCTNIKEIESMCELLTKEKFIEDLTNSIQDFVQNNLPKVIYWKYEREFLITEPINISNFSNDPVNTSVPMKNIFGLIGVEKDKIGEIINESREDENDFRSLLERLSNEATKHIHTKWKEYKDVMVDIQHNTQEFIVSIKDSKKDRNFFNMDARSDGFKRFVSFLFTVSAEYKNEEIKNAIIILDEPDSSLHPSGVRYFLEELLEISKKNYCFAASHSIFLVDKKTLDRHIIVEKKNENTQINFVNESNFINEEVIFNALGTSIFEMIKKNNFLFEGETDRLIFMLLNEKSKNFNLLHLDFKSYGLCNATGVYKIPNFLNFFNDKNVNLITIIDYDDSGIKVKKKIQRSNKVITYEELKLGKNNFTIEDFMPSDLLDNIVNSFISNDSGFSCDIKNKNGFLEQFKEFKGKNKLEIDENSIKKVIPNRLINYLKEMNKEEFESKFENYLKFVDIIKSKID